MKKIIIFVTLIIFDLTIIYVAFGLLLMIYDDSYQESKGEYWSLSSMTFQEKIIYLSFQFWNIVNIIIIVYLVYKIISFIKKTYYNTG
ncbi:putative oligopeptide transporter (OPT) family protein [Wenyingzhuangia aestuarii]|nr:putative oligopeptide transporter (OPT) family protein [Wenyingzhuangia aestuarii]